MRRSVWFGGSGTTGLCLVLLLGVLIAACAETGVVGSTSGAGGDDAQVAADARGGQGDAPGSPGGGKDTSGHGGAIDAGKPDAGITDAATTDAGTTDAAGTDAGTADAGAADVGFADTERTDGGGSDSGAADAGMTDTATTDAATTDAATTDAATTDAGMTDAGTTADAGVTDAGSTGDAGMTDAGTTADATTTDAGAADAGVTDTATADAATPDAGAADVGVTDTATADAATTDSATADAATTDAGTTDAGTTDASTPDAAAPDASTPDASTGGALRFTTPPAAAIAGVAIAPPVQVSLEDAPDHVDESATGAVTLTLDSSAGTATLSGVTTVHAVAGVATFDSLTIDQVGAGLTLVATADGYTDAISAPFDVIAPPPSGETSSLTITPEAVTADGVASASVAVSALDALGAPLGGLDVTVETAGTAIVATPASGTTGDGGAFAASLTSTVAQTAIVSVRVGGSLTLTADVTFTPGPLSAATSSLAATPDSAVAGGPPVTLTATARDAHGNPIAGLTVDLSGPPESTFDSASGVTDQSGAFSTTLSSHVAGTQVVTATMGTVALQAAVVFTAGPPATASVEADPPAVVADGTTASTVTVTVVDAYGNAVPDQSVSFASTGAALLFGAQTGTTGADGAASTTVTSTTAQIATVTATAGDAQGMADVVFTPGPPSAEESAFTATPATVTADGASKMALEVTASDAFGNRIEGLLVTLGPADAGYVFAPGSGTTDAGGVFAATVASSIVHDEALTASMGNLTLLAPVSFVPGDASADTSSITASPTTVVADGASTTTVTVTARDAYGHALEGEAVALSASGAQNTFAPASGTTDPGGTFTATLASTLAQTETVTATLGDALTPVTSDAVSFVPGPPSAATSTLVATPDTVVADGTPVTLTATARDAQGNPIAGQAVELSGAPESTFGSAAGTTDEGGAFSTTLSSLVAGAQVVTATMGPAAPTASVLFTAGPPAGITVEANPATAFANGLSAAVVTATVVDATGNPVPGQGVSFGSTGTALLFGTKTGTTGAGGDASTSVTSTTPQVATVTATAAGLEASTDVTFEPSIADPAHSTVELTGSPILNDGAAQATIVVVARDAAGDIAPGATLDVTVDGAGITLSPPGAQTADATGSATWVVSSTAVGARTVTARVDGAPLSDTPTLVVVAPPVAEVVPPQTVSEPLTGCGTQTSNSGPKVAIDGGNVGYVAMRCGGAVYVAATSTGGADFAEPVDTGIAGVGSAYELQIAGGGPGVAFVAAFSDSGQVLFTMTSDGGQTWSAPVTIGGPPPAFALGAFGLVSVAAAGPDVHVAYLSGTDQQVFSGTGAGAFTQRTSPPIPYADSGFWRLLADPETGALLGVSEVGSLYLAASTDGAATWGPEVTVPGVTGGWSSWATGGGFVFNAGSQATAYRIPLGGPDGLLAATTTVTATPLSGVVVGQPQHTAIAADAAGTLFLVTATPEGVIELQSVAAADTELGPPTHVSLAGGSSPGVAAAGGSALVAWTAGGAVHAAVVDRSAWPSVTVAAAPTSVTADGEATITIGVTVVGGDGDPIADAPVALTASGTATALNPAAGATGPDGVFTATASSTVAQTETIQAAVGAFDPVTSEPLTFAAGAVDLGSATIALVGSPLPADGTTAATVTVTLVDAHGNPVPGATVGLAVSGTGTAIAPEPSIVTGPSGVATFGITATELGTHTVTATVDGTPLADEPTLVVIYPAVSHAVLPIQVSGGLGPCTTEYSNTSQKIAIGPDNRIYLLMNCSTPVWGGEPYVVTSVDGGATFSAPVAAPVVNITAGVYEMQIVAGSEPGTAYVAAINTSSNAYFSKTSDGGATWSGVVQVGFGSTLYQGIYAFANIAAVGSDVLVSYLGPSYPYVYRNTAFGVGPFEAVSDLPLPYDTNVYWRLLADPATGAVFGVDEAGSLTLAASTDAADSWGPVVSVEGATQGWSSWALGGGSIFNAGGTTTAWRIAVSDALDATTTVAATAIPGVVLAAPRQTAIAADDAGNAYIATATPSGAIGVQRVAAGSTDISPPAPVVASGGAFPAVAAGANGAAIVSYTQGGAVYASVVVTAEAPDCSGDTPDNCGGACTNLLSDDDNCGACSKPCLAGSGYSQVCSGGACACYYGSTTMCDGVCVATSNDPANCGSCGHACGPDAPDCYFGQCRCGNSTSVCGNGTVCDAAKACVCPGGLTLCFTPSGTTAGCTDTKSDPENCGGCDKQCPVGWSCSGGSCQSPCGPGLTYCPGQGCVDTTTVDNCGACGATCRVAPGEPGDAVCNQFLYPDGTTGSVCSCTSVFSVACQEGSSGTDAGCQNAQHEDPNECRPGQSCYCTNHGGNNSCGCCGNICASGHICVISTCL